MFRYDPLEVLVGCLLGVEKLPFMVFNQEVFKVEDIPHELKLYAHKTYEILKDSCR